MDLTIIILMATFISRGSLAPVGAKQEHKEIYVKYSILTECELNIQKKCIEVHGTARKLVVGIKVGTCDIKTMIDCFKKEKQKPECTVEDSGTVAYIDSYIKHVDTSKCMDVLGYTEVRELFKSAADFGNQIEYPYPVGTHPSGGLYHGPNYGENDNDDNDDDDEVASGSGKSSNAVLKKI